MDRLSTELNSKIANCLVGDPMAQSAFSKVNKYYRMVGEPYLYRDLVFHPGEGVPLQRLLLTLLRHKELALQISSVQLDENKRSLPFTDAQRITLNNDVWAQASVILDTLQRVTAEASGFTRPRYYTLHWFNALVQDYGPNFDSISVLILCMATNLQRIDIDVSHWSPFRTTPEILMMPWKGVHTHPFKKVTEFSVDGRFGTQYEVVLLPSVVALTV